MKVLTLDNDTFEAVCRALEKRVRDSGFDFDLLIGIATGGSAVADCMMYPARFDIRKQRSATAARRGILPLILPWLPRWVCNHLRVAESLIYGIMAKIRTPRTKTTSLPPELMEKINDLHPGGRILIVDDAVDSGATLLSVKKAVESAATQAEIRTAALTLTRPGGLLSPSPLIVPDYLHYSPGTIVRFPWAPDNQSRDHGKD